VNCLKKWIAREWLYLLGCLGAGVIFVMLVRLCQPRISLPVFEAHYRAA